MHFKLRAVALAAALALTAGGLTTAQAHHGTSGSTATKLTGGTTTVTLGDAAKSGLAAAGITAAPIDPATASGGTFTFPIAGGKVKSSTAFGFVALKGGVKLTKGGRTVKLRRLLIASGPRRAALFASTGRHRLHRFARHRARSSHRRRHGFGRWTAVRRLTNVQRDDAGGKIVITADAALTRHAAKLLNRKLGTTAFAAGDAVGTVTVSATS